MYWNVVNLLSLQAAGATVVAVWFPFVFLTVRRCPASPTHPNRSGQAKVVQKLFSLSDTHTHTCTRKRARHSNPPKNSLTYTIIQPASQPAAAWTWGRKTSHHRHTPLSSSSSSSSRQAAHDQAWWVFVFLYLRSADLPIARQRLLPYHARHSCPSKRGKAAQHITARLAITPYRSGGCDRGEVAAVADGGGLLWAVGSDDDFIWSFAVCVCELPSMCMCVLCLLVRSLSLSWWSFQTGSQRLCVLFATHGENGPRCEITMENFA